MQHCRQASPDTGWPKYADEQRPIIDADNLEALRHFDQTTSAEITSDLELPDARARSLKTMAP